MKKQMLILLVLCSGSTFAQKTGLDLFVRLPQVVDYNFTDRSVNYTPVISGGITLHCRKAFADIGSFVSNGNTVGHYTYFGSQLFARPGTEQFIFNWFGEIIRFPEQPEKESHWTTAVGVSPVLVKPLQWGTFAVAFTLGAALNDDTVSLNSRIVLNYSLPLIKSRL